MSWQVVEPMFWRYPGFDLLTVNSQELLRSGTELESPFVPEAIAPSRNLGFSWLLRLLRNRNDLRSFRGGFSLPVSDWRSVRSGRPRPFGGGSTATCVGNERSVLRPGLREIL